MLQTMWLDLSNLFHAFQASPVNFVQVISDTPLDYGSQLWSPFQVKSINALERVQRVFTKHIDGMHNLSYAERLKSLGIYSLQRRRDRYMAIYMWKILERKVPNFSPPIQCHISDRRGRLCSSGVVPTGRNDRDRAFPLYSFVIKNNLTRAIIYLVGCTEIAIVT